MARKQFTASVFEKKHQQNIGLAKIKLNNIYNSMYKEAALIGVGTGFDDPDREFYLSDFPNAEAKIDALLRGLSAKVESLISDGTDSAWELSYAKNEAMVESLAQYFKMSKEDVNEWSRRSIDALESFRERTVNGMNLSERVWDFVKNDKQQLEYALELGLAQGKSAAALSRDVREYLQNPDKLFRRVRDKDGNLRLSKAAQAYHPGQGVYRSSYKNALRMTITETNMAYRSADNVAWSGMPFVIGQTIKLSNNHTCKGVEGTFFDICDEMQGDYPKEFKFTGWHPHCRCYVIAKLADREELSKYQRMSDEEKANYKFKGTVEDVPKGYKDWMQNNAERIENAKNLPYFIKDNYYGGNVEEGFKWEHTKHTESILEEAEARHNARTPEQIQDIKDRWALRQDEMQYPPEMRAMFRDIEAKLGIKRGFSMPRELADKQNANPLYIKDEKYRINCQTCAPAYVLREWGFDVYALGNTQKAGNLSYYLSKGNNWRETWTDLAGKPIKTMSFGEFATSKGWKQMNAKRYMQYFDEVCAEDGTYEIGLSWKGKGGHCTIVKRESGLLSYIEPQLDNSPASTRAWNNISMLCDRMTTKPWGLDGAIRADNALFNVKYVDIFDKNAYKTLSAQKDAIGKAIGTKTGEDPLHPLYVKPESFSRSDRVKNIKHMLGNRRLNAEIVYRTDTRNGRLFVSLSADHKDIVPNIRVANSLLDNYSDMKITIRHDYSFDHVKNPEYLINGLLSDRKSIQTLKGIPSAVKSAIDQYCQSVVIDLDTNGLKLNTRNIYSGLNARRRDFSDGKIKECYILKNNKAIKIDESFLRNDGKMDFGKIETEIKKLE